MLKFLSGVGSTLLLVTAGFFFWKGRAEEERALPPAPAPRLLQLKAGDLPQPAATEERSKEEKRFSRADKDDDGRITQAELLEPRRKAFAKLDKNGDGRLAFEEWAVSTIDKFAGADADKSGALTPAEFATTKPKPAKKRCAC